MNPELAGYVSEARAQGQSDEAIRQTLASAGWAAADVAEALGTTGSNAPHAAAPAPMPPMASATPAASSTPASSSVLYATYWRKFFAEIIDGFIVMLVPMIALGIVLALYAGASARIVSGTGVDAGARAFRTILSLIGIIIVLLTLVWAFLYRAVFEGRKGATPGMRLLGLRVVLLERPTQVGIGVLLSLGRSILNGVLSSLTGSFTYNWMLIDERRQGVHDKATGVVVLHDPSKKFSFGDLSAVPLRKKRWVWFALCALFALVAIGGALSGGSR